MKDIVVAIDFSKGSEHALEYAIELANLTHTNVIMVWVDSLSGTDSAVTSESKVYRNESKNNLTDLLAKYKNRLLHGKLTAKVRKGRVYQELGTFIKQNECCLLVIGAHGASGFEEFWIGTNAFRIVSSVTCPVITVKYNYEVKRGYRKILMPVYHTARSLEKVSFTAKLAKATGADVNVLALSASGLKSMQKMIDSHLVKIKKQFDELGINFIVDNIKSENLAYDILEHAKLVDADLIAIMTDVQDHANSVMLGPFAQQLVNYSPVPVLSVHPNDKYK